MKATVDQIKSLVLDADRSMVVLIDTNYVALSPVHQSGSAHFTIILPSGLKAYIIPKHSQLLGGKKSEQPF